MTTVLLDQDNASQERTAFLKNARRVLAVTVPYLFQSFYRWLKHLHLSGKNPASPMNFQIGMVDWRANQPERHMRLWDPRCRYTDFL